MLNTLLKKIGRRKAGTWNAPRKKHLKNIANRAVRRARMLQLEADYRAGMV